MIREGEVIIHKRYMKIENLMNPKDSFSAFPDDIHSNKVFFITAPTYSCVNAVLEKFQSIFSVIRRIKNLERHLIKETENLSTLLQQHKKTNV
jgi:hypothetical protein